MRAPGPRGRAGGRSASTRGVFSIFDLGAPSFDLVNADYIVGLPLTFPYEDFSMQLRVFHQSSHLGDEFLLRTRTNRVNLSYESVDLKLSYEFLDLLRMYAGGGYLFDQDPSMHPWSVQYGVELTSPWPSRPSRWRPIAAVDIQHREENNWSADVSARAGIEIDGVLLTRKSSSCSNTSTAIRRTGSSTRTRSSISVSAHTSTSDPLSG